MSPPPGPVSYLQLRSASDPTQTVAFLLPLGHSIGGGPKALGALAGDLGEAEYVTNATHHRAFLFQGDLAAGIFSVAGRTRYYLQLPQYSGGPGPDIQDVLAAPPVADSFRVYDSGECSQIVPWSDLVEPLIRGIEVKLAESPDITGATRTVPTRVYPVLRGTGRGPILDVDIDRPRGIWLPRGQHRRRIGL